MRGAIFTTRCCGVFNINNHWLCKVKKNSCVTQFWCIIKTQFTISGLSKGDEKMRTDWTDDTSLGFVLTAMTPPNRLALQVARATGLRIDDVLSLQTSKVAATARPYVTDSKTGKTHRIYLPAALRDRMLQEAGKYYIFPGRTNPRKHRTRQAVWKDMKRAASIMRTAGHLQPGINVAPHSVRKAAAVSAFQSGGLDAAVQLLQHDKGHPGTTLLYCMADQAKPRKHRKKRG